MAVDTATKRCSALSAWMPWSFGSVPAGTVNRQDALWSYTGVTAATITAAHLTAVVVTGPTRAFTIYGPDKTSVVVGPRRSYVIGN